MSQESLTPESVPRANGMPMLGIGTWQNEDPDQCEESVRTALETGYRHVDTAQAYGNEPAVGDGIAAADVSREDIFLATKVWIDRLDHDGVVESTEESLEKLGVDTLDLLYVHWPSRTYDPEKTLPALESLKDRGLIDRIAVSNFEPHHIDEAREVLDGPIFANQVEMHPLLQQAELREYAAEADIELVAYSPLIRGRVFDVPELTAVAEKHGVSEAQVSLAWLREKGVTAIPKATSEAHIRDNWESAALTLDDEDVATIDGIDETDRQIDPGFGPDAWD
jgi:diketogulonate reductase-like aldo/keto reductase